MSDAAPKPARERERLPSRRVSETRKLHWAERTIFVTIGYGGADHLEPREIFYNGGYRSGSDMEALVSDLCIALSVMLQHEGITAATLGKSMGEAFDLLTGDPVPASILGLLLEELSRPPDWAGPAMAQGEGPEPDHSDDLEISGAAEVDPRATGEAGRQAVPGREGAARHLHSGHRADATANGETLT